MANPSKQKGDPHPNSVRSHSVGMVGEGEFIAWASNQGWHLYRGMDGHTPCDFVADTGHGLVRVEVKRCETPLLSDKNYYYHMLTKLCTDRFDRLFVSTPHGAYWIPAAEVPGTALNIKVVGPEEMYVRNITKPGKWHDYRVELP